MTKINIRPYSTADTCKSCTECDKGFKLRTNEAYNMKIKISGWSILKIFSCSYANMATSDKGISVKRKFLKNFHLTSFVKRNQWKELIKLIQNDRGTILIG